jgi:tetratricopeptide (TPR) repeat protein
MAEPTYLNFDLELERRAQGYGAQVVASPLDRACCSEFSLPLDDAPPGELASLEEIKAFGSRLFQAVFDDEIYSYLRLSQDEAERQGADGLRIRLILTEVPELADLPWEYLYDPGRAQFLSLSTKTPIVRYLDLSERVHPLAVKPPLRVLVMISSPKDQPALDVDQEWTQLSQALAELQAAGRVELELLKDATLPTLQNQLRQREYHVFHYVGHGAFDDGLQDGLLILENEEGLSQPVRGEVLGALLHNGPTLKLALLNACEGAKGSRSDPFAGTAQSLVRKQIPAVIAMQTAISDEAAKTFAAEFYRALADDYPVDKALTEARMAIYLQGNEREWAIPVLFMRTSDARLEAAKPAAAAPVQLAVAVETKAPARRKVRIGPMAIPLVPLIGVPLLLLAVLGVLAFVLPGPAQMSERFNVAIADVAVLDDQGQVRRTDESQQLTRWIVESIEGANATSQRGNIALWHDGLPLTEKRTRLGAVAGRTAPERAQAAAKLAEKVNAHVVIYAHIDESQDPPQFGLEFFVAPRVRRESAAVIGRYQLGDPISIPEGFTQDPLAAESVGGRVEDRAALMFWLLLGLRDDLLGEPAQALALLRDAEAELTSLPERGEGKEHLYYLEGRAALFMNAYAEAEASLQKALGSNPDYARAQMALGSVYLDMAQTEQTSEERLQDPSNLERAVANYQRALDLATQANEPLTEIIAHLALAGAYRLEAETLKSVATPDFAAAGMLYEQAIDELRLVLEPLEQAEQYRLLAQAYATLGAAYLQHGQLLEIRGERPAAKAQYEAAQETYASCIAQGEKAPEDKLLRSEIIDHEQNGCQRWADATEDILSSFDGG